MKTKLILLISLLLLSLEAFSQADTRTRQFLLVPQWIALEIERELAELDSIRVEHHILIRNYKKCQAELETLALISAGLSDSLSWYQEKINTLEKENLMINRRKENIYLKYKDLQEIQHRKELKNYSRSDERKLHASIFLNVVLVVLVLVIR